MNQLTINSPLILHALGVPFLFKYMVFISKKQKK